MAIYKIKHEVSDPAFYDSLISDQKKKARRNPNTAKEWLKLGRLCEARLDMITVFAKRKFLIRWLPLLTCLCFFALIAILYFIPPVLHPGIVIAAVSICALGLVFIGSVRYPPSGIKYFRNVIALDPKCGDAYMHLGVIALRRHQKRRGCRYFELAVELNANNKNKIEQELKSIYEKELDSYFNKRSDKDTRQQQIIDDQQDQIKTFRVQKSDLEKRVESLSRKLDQAKWEMGHKTKKLDEEMKTHISAIRQDHEDQIDVLKHEAKEEAKELAQRDFIGLTTEIMESKASLEVQSLHAAAQTVEATIGRASWRSFSEQTRSFLATAEQVYTVLTEQEENPDYSLVGMELCKALEVELNRKLVEPFAMYLDGKKSNFLRINKTGTTKGGPAYYTYLAKVVDRANYPGVSSLTLGQCHFALKLALEGDYALSEYANFLDDICAASRTIIGRTFSEKLKTVVHKYRNAIAHHSPMNKNEYENLRDLIFTGKETLLSVVATLC
jgi:tetratricopeptide (TPR) repeat protein